MIWVFLSLTSAEAKKPWCWVKSGMYAGRTQIEFQTGAELAAEEQRRAAAELRAPMAVPAKGAVVFHVERGTIEMADGRNQLFVLESGGRQIARYEPDPDVAETPAGLYKFWWNIFVMAVPDDAGFPLTVHAADKTAAHRCSWSVAESGAVTKL